MEGRFSSFTVLIAKISREIRRIKTEEMAELSLKSPHVSCLYYLYTQGSMTVRELCDICDEDKAAISRSLEYLEECGCIVRDHADGRRYKAPLVLTEGGREIAERVTEKIERVLGEVGQGLSDEDRATLYTGLRLISEDLEAIGVKYAKKRKK